MEQKNRMMRQLIGNSGASQAGSDVFEHNLINSIVQNDAQQKAIESIDNALLDEFKNQVRMWWQYDTDIKRLQIAIRERKTAQNHITDKVLDFMKRHNIEDLNTKEGVLRYRTSVVKAPLSQKSIKTKLSEYFERDPNAMNFIKKIFEDREKVEKVSLRRLKI
jgi:Family of unknown function (DUF5760)